MKHIKSSSIVVVLLNLPNLLLAQSNSPNTIKAPTVPTVFFSSTFWILFFTFMVLLLVIISLVSTLQKLTIALVPAEERKRASEEKRARSENKRIQGSFWDNLDRKVLTRAVPVEKEADIMLSHAYDGIRELDNNLPPWWKWGFYATIVWGFAYLIHFHVFSTGLNSGQEYQRELADAKAAVIEYQSRMANFISAENVTVLNTSEGIASGKSIFSKNCTACHGQLGEGLVGPNLTDSYWLHGGGIREVFKVITNGVPAKGMIAWKAQLSPKQVQEVASYVLSLKGTNPANPKAPEGEIWKATLDSANAAPTELSSL